MRLWKRNFLIYVVFNFWFIVEAERNVTQNVTEMLPVTTANPLRNLTSSLEDMSTGQPRNGTTDEIREQKSPFPKSCGRQNLTIRSRILGGKEATLGEFPWLARLIHKNNAGNRIFGCTGFLISSKFVLTAAHCLLSENNQFLGPVFEVHLGEHNTKTKIDCNAKNTTCADKVQILRVNEIIPHPSYSMTSKHHHHDIGLIYLKKGVKLTSYVSPICLIDKLEFEPFEYWLSGWGSTETENVSPVKMKVSVPPYPHHNCTKKYGQLHVKIIDKQLCAGGKKNKDSCAGDSGGPLMLVVNGTHWFAAGVVSYGMGCGRQDWPAIYTNITSYSGWIKSTMLKCQNENIKVKH
ncbi:phenoloxidase-activating enzyme 1-like isoform X3 [Zophobas morio]|uniref:phenoloxidase-activating enzyme 1-like isoform X3 n=1 Tax=Zophobas morio TaxID=2755281 RepID=UPI0030835EFC